MLDIGPGVSDDESLLVVVDRLGAAGSDRVAARAHEQVRRAVMARVPLPGLRHLTANLAAVDAGELPPPPRHPADEPGSVVAAVRDNPLMILDDVEPAEVAAAVAALVERRPAGHRHGGRHRRAERGAQRAARGRHRPDRRRTTRARPC